MALESNFTLNDTHCSDGCSQESNNDLKLQSNSPNKMTRRTFLNGLGSLAVGVAIAGCSTKLDRTEQVVNVTINCLASDQRESELPNIIFIMADDLGYGDLGVYGQTQIQTPHLDTFAEEGMRFTQCYAGSTVCAPSRCTLLTGLHTGHARIRANNKETVLLRPQDYTVSELLKCAGYKTGIFGKWGLARADSPMGKPNEKGFDEWFGYLTHAEAHNYYPNRLWRNGQAVDINGNQANQKSVYTPDLLAEEALNFISTNKNTPFFLYLPYTLPHANNALGRETGNGMEIPSDEPYSDKNWPQQEKNFAAMVTKMDELVGQLLVHVKKEGLDENTIIFFTSDNGPHQEGGHDPTFFKSSGPLRGIKRDLYEGGIRVPMMIRWPGKITPGSVNDQPWAFWDFLPTVADVVGVDLPIAQLDEVYLPRQVDGISVLPTILNPDHSLEREFLYWEFKQKNGADFKQAVRTGNWKGIRNKINGSIELYNLDKDVNEQNDVARSHSKITARIAEIMETARVDSPDFPVED